MHTLHQRVSIRTLPIDVAMEQQRVLDSLYLSDIVMSNATRSMYICTSCALAGRPTALRHPMRYSMLNQRFTCMSCHRQQRAKGQQQQRRDKGARLMSSDTSIICVDMIGKVVYTGMDLSPSLWRCYAFCMQCVQVHEVQDGPTYMCPFSMPPVTASHKSYHMLNGRGGMPVALDRDLHPLDSPSKNKKKGCSICSSIAVSSRVDVMVRRCAEAGAPVTYCMEIRSFCQKHSPPPNLVSSGRFIDERQLMEFCFLKDSHKNAFGASRVKGTSRSL